MSNTHSPESNPATSSTMPPPQTLSLTLILAATPSLGIGCAGTLPWPQLRKEMGYFKRVTSRVSSSSSPNIPVRRKCNAVVMGRKTWDSIPLKFRPLDGRVNVVVTRTPEAFAAQQGGEGKDEVEAVGSVSAALERLQEYNSQPGEGGLEIERVFVIGGATIYDAALQLPQTDRVLLTKIEKDFECDTFFSVDLDRSGHWKRSTKAELEDWTGEKTEPIEEKEIRFEFRMYERVTR